MSKYDDASWHYGGEFPDDLTPEKGATHIGMFMRWCLERKLYSEELEEDAEEEIDDVINGELTGADFVIQVCDEKLATYDLNQEGNAFAKDYYEDETDFAEHYNSFADDYESIFIQHAHDTNTHLESFYHVEDTEENYQLIKPIIDKRFAQWLEYDK